MLKKLTEIITRLVIGYLFIESGIGKFKDLSKVISYFESLKIPFAHIQAPVVSAFELIFGIFILVGFYTRISTLPLIGIMTVAIVTAKAEDVSDFSSLIGVSEFLYILLLLWLLANGSHTLSVDTWRVKKKK